MPNLDDIIWAAITFRDFNYNFAYLKILREMSFLKTLRISPIDLEVNEGKNWGQACNIWICAIISSHGS